uniref:Protein white n=1 Tax=Timema genevievae TaxID=629358 RepID=A0A7R9PMX8_TIMGE|nr:unnamed protein product [Timema genevievae]
MMVLVSGIAYPGELLAIMGSSGAGKTTLLNTLMFKSSPNVMVSGYTVLNGYPVSSGTLSSLSAYVQQDDLFIGTLTVREHLVFQALVRMDRHIPYKQRMEMNKSLLSWRCLNVKTPQSAYLGGSRVFQEVLTDPPLMFCDEPTSGLDSFMAQNVVSVLKAMANKGKTVVSTIHQPSSEVFSLFDKVLLMAEGRVAFLGSTDEACTFFQQMGAACPSNYNPADYFIQLLAVIPTREDSCKQTIELICDNFQNSEIGLKIHHDTEPRTDLQRSPYKASWWAQMRAVLWRSWMATMKEPVLIKVRILQTLLVGLLIGVIYYGQELNQDGVMNINGAIFILITNMTFQNVFAVINVFCAELPVFKREHFNGMYRTDVYFLCKTIAEIPVFIVIPVIFISISYYMIGLSPGPERFWMAVFILTLTANVATSFGYFISCVSSNVDMALTIGPPVIIPFLLFGGFLLNNSSVPIYFKWLSYLSWFKYANEALLINQWEGVDHIDCTASNTTCPKNGLVVVETLNFSFANLDMDLMSLAGLIIGFRFLAYLALLSRTYRSY